MTKLAANLPKGEANGLVAIARDLVEDPHEVHAVIALVDCKKTTTDNDTGEVIPTARIRRIEVVTGEDLGLVERAIRRALEKRTGATTLPIELEDEFTEVFQHVKFDKRTGEVLDDEGP